MKIGEYRLPRQVTMLIRVTAALLCVMALFVSARDYLENAEAQLFIPPAALLAIGGYFLIASFRIKIVLHDDAISATGVFGTRTLRRADIRGRKSGMHRGVRTHRIYAKAKFVRPITFSDFIVRDQAFRAWLACIPEMR